MAALEKAVLNALPPAMMRPVDLVAAGMKRLDHAKALFGSIEIVGITELSPCWRPLLSALSERIPVKWNAGPRSFPRWLDSERIEIVCAEPEVPEVMCVSAATAQHEAIEALRWARELVVSGQAKPCEIAIASVTTSDYDDHLLALRADADLNLHFVHGVKVSASREGQAAAALADILLRGLSQTMMRRLSALLISSPGPFHSLPYGWMRILPEDAPLASIESWTRVIDKTAAADWPDGVNHGADLQEIVSHLAQGVAAAEIAGAVLLHGRSLTIWGKALVAGPSVSLDLTLESLRLDDGFEACTSIGWMPANELAASPRRFVRLLGFNSSRWPRGISEDRLLSNHIINTAELDPLPAGEADRRDFATILATTKCQVVLSRARRNSDGRLLGRSVLLYGHPEELYLRRNNVPHHAFSETDRLMARPSEFRAFPQALSASGCWRDWNRREITPHDGAVRADHPVIQAILGRRQSASSLAQLLRNPVGFVWKYGMHWRAPETSEEPLVLDPRAIGELVHMVLDRALAAVEADGGLSFATEEQIAAAVDASATDVAQIWADERAVPPRVLWRRTLEDVRALSCFALRFANEPSPGVRAYGEVPFGGIEPKNDIAPPWDATAIVEIPGTGFSISGYIDRLDFNAAGRCAKVLDYKTGRSPSGDIVLNGGKELQRCFYAFAVKALLGGDVDITASLLYLRDEVELNLPDPEATLLGIAAALSEARANLISGGSVVGIDTGGEYDDLALALPANAGAAYCKRKLAVATERIGNAAKVWEAQ